MTTSNHRPFTYPDGKIDIPSGSGREGAVKYTDYAIGAFLKKIKISHGIKILLLLLLQTTVLAAPGKMKLIYQNTTFPR
jgi:phosphoglycerol transferase MdoB-like AlkP superfamily enzyme